MQRHTDQLYRLAELPAFIEEALSNVSLKYMIARYLKRNGETTIAAIDSIAYTYAEEWVDDWMDRNKVAIDLWAFVDVRDSVDPEIRAIDAGVKLFSNPDCKAGLPE